MKKLLILSIIILITTGCTKKRILESYELHELETNTDLIVVKHDFQDRVDAVFKYPYSSLYYEYVGENQLEYKYTNPLIELANRCFKSDLKVGATYLTPKTTIYRIAFTQDEIDKCINLRANEPIDDYAISILSRSDIYEDYKNNPHFRNSMNLYKADGMITISEYMNMYRALYEIKEAEIKAKNKRRITEL